MLNICFLLAFICSFFSQIKILLKPLFHFPYIFIITLTESTNECQILFKQMRDKQFFVYFYFKE